MSKEDCENDLITKRAPINNKSSMIRPPKNANELNPLDDTYVVEYVVFNVDFWMVISAEAKAVLLEYTFSREEGYSSTIPDADYPPPFYMVYSLRSTDR